MKRRGRDERRTWHVVGGFPELDDDCPICRAHGIDPKDGPQILPITMEEITMCPCPLCTNARIPELDN
jgi:hypothetical protein